ncbi:MAG: sulfatase-like hydrolase/transferase [Planctomycetales bacterium]|nr:sulfatase-like hydrolase/transferase [Planctomycetales bacterium]NIM08004.1 sulfatase-like hydrolase/transferase [Planctomycetales bacterium]NIN07486.1 sulfatase-like hydrolase/transferase [Planctomycetales bacterium]NIN76591.1 sulfatase-like hydrolase/transferase [Planctomycetales bacterium]NIO33781.1 sulfatase-like hydrolase/transferase [Planctomycetales bacterium]
MTSKFVTRLTLIAALFWAYSPRPTSAEQARPAKPNVVMILTDDVGWQDVKCYDIDRPSPMETPHLDALANRGVLFWQAYAPAPTCAPTRCAILSGNHPARAQKTHVVGGGPPVPYHRSKFRMLPPWYSGRMPAGERTLARVLSEHGYATGHCGKWHMAIDHHAFPQPEDQGFDWTRHHLGTTAKMRPHRLTGFATHKPDDPFRLDENGFAYHQNSEDALTFVRENMDRPFFLYYCTWLVHTPIHTRSKQLLDKYCQKLGVDLPENPEEWNGAGQTNPFYCAMVEELDYYLGQLFDYLRQTEDPRWPGHKLSENTYVIFTSDNGGMERVPGQIITDNDPLDRGKISLMEGGTRVPLIITGPHIPAGIESHAMVNGLDFYPTILSWAGIPQPAGKRLDGCDLAPLLSQNPQDPSLVRQADGRVRDTMVWHFPHSVALESSIRVGDYKLVRNYDHVGNGQTAELELYRLYQTGQGKPLRVDIEEANNLAESLPEKAQELNRRLTEILTEMKASYPYYNPDFQGHLPHKHQVPRVVAHQRNGNEVQFRYREQGSKVVRANLIYTLNGGQPSEEWYRQPAQLTAGHKLVAQLPPGTTHYFINLIDQHNFLVSYPEPIDMVTKGKTGANYSERALSAPQRKPVPQSTAAQPPDPAPPAD